MSRGWTTPSSSWCWRRWCRWSRRGNQEWLWKRLPILAVFRSVWCIRCFSITFREIAKHGYIVGQDGSVESKIASKQRTRRERGPTMQPKVGPAWSLLFSSLLRSLLTSSSHNLLFPKKVTWQKVWVHLTSERSLKLKNMQKQENLLRSVKMDERGLFRKPPESMSNKSRSL
jgi:hypothetical protein